MRELVALLFAVVLISVGWYRPYREHFSFATNALAKTGLIAPGKWATSAPTPAVQPAPETSTSKTWMWEKSTLDSKKQSGVDRAGVHTSEPMLRN
jgi:hypothetical protein